MKRAASGALFAVLLLVLVALLALLCAGAPRGAPVFGAIVGGAAARKRADMSHIRSPGARSRAEKADVVVDTLNLTHRLIDAGALDADADAAREIRAGRRISKCTIFAAIRHSAPLLREYFPSRIIYVVKDRDGHLSTPCTRPFYVRLAREERVHIHMVERPADEAGAPAAIDRARESWHTSGEAGTTHQQKGRDDFYIGLLAWKLRCGALTDDRMRDFDKLKTEVRPFIVHEITPWTDQSPLKNYVNPGAREYQRVRAPTRLRYADYGL